MVKRKVILQCDARVCTNEYGFTARLGERFDIKLILDGLEKIGWRVDRKHSRCWCPDHANQALSEGKE